MSYSNSQRVRTGQLVDELSQLADKFEKNGRHDEAAKTRALLENVLRLEDRDCVEAVEE